MKKLFLLCSLFFSFLFSAQTDYSDSWEDLYSYNNVKDIVKVDEVIYAFEKFDQIEEILTTVDRSLFKTKLFTVKRIEDFRINTYLSETGKELYKEMVGCNGNLFFLYLKEYYRALCPC